MKLKYIFMSLPIIFLLIIGYIYFFKFSSKKMIIVEKKTLKLEGDFNKKYPSTLFPISTDGKKYTLSFMIYVKNNSENSNWDNGYNEHKGILSRFGSPNIIYFPKVNILRISVMYKNDYGIKKYYYFDIKNFNYQKWEHIILVVNNRNVDVYLNGNMIKSTHLPNVPFILNKEVFVGQKGNNFNGEIKDIEYLNDSLNPIEALDHYKNKKI